MRLLDPDLADNLDDIHAIFPLDVTGGGEASGAWQLTVADNFREDVGTLDRWSIGINTTAP